MKELHNHIFSNTTCVSKELMMKYINKQLTKAELYEIEKHMLDCDLCTEAIAGMRYAKNSSVLFAIDHKISKKASNKNSFFKNNSWLMAAASLVALIFGAYFLINFIDENKFNQTEMALISEKDETKTQQNQLIESTSPQNEISPAQSEITQDEHLEPSFAKQLSDRKEVEIAPKTKQTPQSKNVTYTILDEEVADIKEAKISLNRSKEEVSDAFDNEDNEQEPANYAVSANVLSTSANDDLENKLENEKNKAKKKYIAINSAPSAGIEAVKSSTNKDKSNQNTYYLYENKVVDYAVAYQNEEDFKKQADNNGTPADYISPQEKAAEEKLLENNVVVETYKEVLERGMLNFKNLAYKKALADFELILAKHPLDVNAQFYGGLSAYNLKNYTKALLQFEATLQNNETAFNQEAKWHKALTLIELNEIKKAKKLLQEIVDQSGFYKEKAQKKLEELK